MKLSTNLPHQNPEDLFSAEAAPKAKRTDGPNGTVYDSDGIRRESTREAELRAELAGRKVSHLPPTTVAAAESDGRTVFSVPEQNGGLQNGMEPAASSPPPPRAEPETIPMQNAAQHQPNPSPQHQPPRPLLITQQSATGQSQSCTM